MCKILFRPAESTRAGWIYKPKSRGADLHENLGAFVLLAIRQHHRLGLDALAAALQRCSTPAQWYTTMWMEGCSLTCTTGPADFSNQDALAW